MLLPLSIMTVPTLSLPVVIGGAGGQVLKVGPCHRVDGNLNLSRALGDFDFKANSELQKRGRER